MTTELITSPAPTIGTKESPTRDLRGIACKADELIREAGHTVAEEFAIRRNAMSDGASRAVSATHEFARDNPWKVIGVAAVAGLVIGALISRR